MLKDAKLTFCSFQPIRRHALSGFVSCGFLSRLRGNLSSQTLKSFVNLDAIVLCHNVNKSLVPQRTPCLLSVGGISYPPCCFGVP